MRTGLAIVGCVVLIGLSAASAAAQAAVGQVPAGQPTRGRGGAPTPASCGPNPPAELKHVAKGSRCFELRTYTMRPEGPGNPDLLHTRFRDRLMPIFKKHNMDVVGFWQPVAKPDTVIYLLAFKDASTRDAAWAAFNADPDWIKTRTEMAVGVTVTSEFMIATDYGPMK